MWEVDGVSRVPGIKIRESGEIEALQEEIESLREEITHLKVQVSIFHDAGAHWKQIAYSMGYNPESNINP